MIGLCILIYGLLGSWLLGVGFVLSLRSFVARRNAGNLPPLERLECMGLGLVMGIGLTGWLQLIASLSGIPLGRPLSLVLATIGWLWGGTAWLRGRNSREVSRQPRSPLAGFLQGLIALLFVNLLIQSLLTPQHLWDERAIYAIKAAVEYEDHAINSPDQLAADFVQYHPRYPLLIPLAEQHVYALSGEQNDRTSKVLFPLLYLGMLLTIGGLLSRHFAAGWAWLCSVLLGTVPVVGFWEYGFLCGQGDAPLACCHGLSVLYLWDCFRHWDRQSPADASTAPAIRFALSLAGLLAGLAIFVKDEGIAFLMVDAACVGLFFLVRNSVSWSSRLRSSLGFFLSALVIVAPWFWHRSGLPRTGEMTYFDRLSIDALTTGIATLGWSTRHLLSRMFREANEWGLQWWGMVLSAVTCPHRLLSPAQLFLVVDVLGALCGLIVAGMIAPTPVEEHLGGSSHRFLLQLVPVAVLFLAGQWAPDRRSRAGVNLLASGNSLDPRRRGNDDGPRG